VGLQDVWLVAGDLLRRERAFEVAEEDIGGLQVFLDCRKWVDASLLDTSGQHDVPDGPEGQWLGNRRGRGESGE